MKTTIYELLGMIKDNNIPQRIIFKDQIYEYVESAEDYYNEEHGYIFDVYVLKSILNEEATILETTITYNQEEKITLEDFKNLGYSLSKIKDKFQEGWEEAEKEDNKIEKLKTHKEIDEPDYYANILEVYDGGECEIDEVTSFIVDKINEIIDYINKGGISRNKDQV